MANPVPYITKNTLVRTDRKGYAVELFVVHETVGSYPGDLNWLVGSGQVSVNWYIRRDGQLFCLDDQFGATAHAGVCAWGTHGTSEQKGGWGWANLASEGVEMEGPCDGTPFTPAQIQTLIALTRWRCAVRGLGFDRVVRHLDIAMPKAPPKGPRKTDPRGIDWEWFKRSLPEVALAPVSTTLGGQTGSFACDPDFKAYYDAHGGLLTFGFALAAQHDAPDTTGEVCQWVRCENAVLKRKPSMPDSWRLRPASLTEIAALGSAI